MFYRAAVILIIISISLKAQWYPQNTGTIYALKSIYFINEQTGFSCGYNTILKTTNSGINWSNFYLTGNHQSIFFTDLTNGFICSDSGKIFKTTNAGNTWVLKISGTINNLTSVNFYDANTGIITGLEKTLLKTTNSGENWFSVTNNLPEINFLASEFIDAQNFYVTGSNSFIIKTTNGGLNWMQYTLDEVNPIFTIEFNSPSNGIATGCCGMLMVTTNGGINWTDYNYLSLGFTFYSLVFSDNNTGFMAGDNGMLYRTTDNGFNWDSTLTGTSQNLYSLFMLNNNTGWISGGYGTILKTTNGGGPGYPIGINSISSDVPDKFMLYQNYPNPFNPETKIKFEIKSNEKNINTKTELKIYDALGTEISVLYSGFLTPGSYEINYDGSNLPSGIYYYNLRSSEVSLTRKMVLLK